MANAPKKTVQSQHERFVEAARDLGADEDEDAFEQRLRAVAGGNSPSGGAETPKPEPARPRKRK